METESGTHYLKQVPLFADLTDAEIEDLMAQAK